MRSSIRRSLLAGAALVAVLALVGSAWGQGLYYREAERDGKLYVFNLAQQYDAFQQGTPPAKPIERLGWGPKGETVVFDSPDALNLFAFKHGKAPEAPPAPKVEAKKEEPKNDEPKPIRFSGYVFGDIYYFPQHHDAKFDGQVGLWLRRGYFTVDRDLGSAWSMRFRLEVNSPSLQQTQDALKPYVKDAYLRWTHGAQNVFLGISPSPTWELIEGFWGYRHVEKTPLDLHGWAGSRDTGLAAKGTFDKGKKLGYHAMIGTGTGVRNETNKEQRYYLALAARPTKSWVFEAYADFESRPDDKDIQTLQAFGGYEGKSFKLGLQYARQTRQQGPGRDDLELDILSGFATGTINPKVLWLARVDRGFDPNPNGASIPYLPFDPTAKSTLFLAGLEFLPIPSVHLTPNVEIVTYDDADPKPKTDVVARLTFYWTF
jgi:hypothetical protein